MGIRFRKSFKVAPGVKVNLGKKSAGVSIGGRHGGVSFNTKSGARVRASAPGTGISYSAKISGGNKSSKKSHSSTSNTTTQQQESRIITQDKKYRAMALQHNLTKESAKHYQYVFVIITVFSFLIGTLTAAVAMVSGIFIITGCITWYYAVQYGRCKKFIEQNTKYQDQPLPDVNILSLQEQNLKIIKDCMNVINSTKNPDTYFMRYSLMEEKIDELICIHGARYIGQTPIEIKQQVLNEKQASIHGLIDRYFGDVTIKAEKLKTDSGKKNKYAIFVSTLEVYYDLMDESNINYIQTLYNNAISYINA